ncbi:MAG: coenzyme F420-0:L-glutamate ligase / coenzyme F420:gamma-L-glutamate ligase [Gaiellales bacterium]|nr:coenzyme F420-0:L-glutamate ligase / coenzyme F420:gamma-L-glutamate ligase [Gaiellales bacterium]
MSDLAVIGLRGLPELAPGDDLAGLLVAAAERCAGGLRDGDIVCVAQKAVSKVEGRSVALESVTPTPRAIEIAADEGDPRMIELILGESTRIVRRRGAFLICETRHGFVCAAAGVDRSNAGGGDVAILLPLDPDASARRLRDAFAAAAEVGVIVTDSFGRPFRLGTTGVAVGCAGIAPVSVHTGESDDAGRVLQGTELHVADQVASAAELVVGPFGGVPAAVVRGLAYARSDVGASAGLMPGERDLFRGADRSG